MSSRRSIWPLVLAIAALIALALLVFVLLALFRPSNDALAARPAPVPHLELWQCVHRQERTAWNDPNPPYLGGLQLGTGWFIPHYSKLLPHPAGTVDTWTPRDQMLFAEGAYRLERYSTKWLYGQWPPSRGVCF